MIKINKIVLAGFLLFAASSLHAAIPTILSLNPTSVQAGGPAFTLAVSGSNLVSGAVVRWNGADRPTSGVGSQLSAAIPASDIATGGAARIAVVNPAPAVARQVRRRLETHDLLAPPGADPLEQFFCSGDERIVSGVLTTLWGRPVLAEPLPPEAALPASG